jgi:hypothetical protein
MLRNGIEMADYVLFGDTEGALGARTVAAAQTLFGGPVPFTMAFIVGDAGALVDRAMGGDDRILSLLATTMTLTGDATVMRNRAVGGDDTFNGLSGVFNTLYGDAETMANRTRGGDDFLSAPSSLANAPAATSDLHGDAYVLRGRAVGGDDTLIGGKGDGASVARLFGDGHDLLGHAVGGDDRLESFGYATDEMWGDAYTVGPNATTGHDTFVFAPGNGRDIIHDFEQGKDLIDLSAFAPAGITDFDVLSARIVEQPDGTLVILDVDGLLGNSVVVAGVTGLAAGDFIFG